MGETKSPEFWNGGGIKSHDDYLEVVRWVNGLSKSDLMEVVNGMLLYP